MPAKFTGISNATVRHSVAWLALLLASIFFSAPVAAQQTGEIIGAVTDNSGQPIGGVAVEASGNTLPQNRTTTTATNGRYRLPLLPPGSYEIRYRFSDGSERVRTTNVLLQQQTEINVIFDAAATTGMEEIVVTASQVLADTGQASLKNSIDSTTVDALPVGQEYRDLQKLIPGVQYTEDSVRGPSAGGNGQDNMYQFDGVDVSLPLFGTLSAEPSSHDIAQVSIVRGGAKAIGFNRSGGFLMNTVSKSGTDEFHGEISYQAQTADMTGDRKTGDNPEEFDTDKTWTTLSIGGPILRDRLYFYTSYYRPTEDRSNSANAYGPVPDYDSTRDEYFAKLTFSPTDNILLDGSYRTSDREINNRSTDEFGAASTAVGDEATLDIAILEGSWIVSDAGSLNFKYTDFQNDTAARPDTIFDFPIAVGDSLNVGALDTQGNFIVPTPIAGETAYNAFIQPLIDQYGYSANGVQTGGGNVGGASTIDEQNFGRTSFEIGYDHTLYWGGVTHDLHVGYQWQELNEELIRTSNGWGIITAPGGRVLGTDGVTPIYYIASIDQQSLSGANTVPAINSEVEMQSFEINDTIMVGDWTYNVGILFSNDVLYGQGLAKDSSNPLTGFRQEPGSKYKMYEVDWSDMIQPRLGVNWDYSDTSSVYFNYAKYNPAASSLARAASWDRNLRSTIEVGFDANGDFVQIDPFDSSSGKWFQDGMEPRSIDEFLVGWTSDIANGLTLRAHVRYREGKHFWEDTNNNARVDFNPPAGIPRTLYIPNLDDIRAEIGGSSFVVAELDGGYTKYYEAGLEAEWILDSLYLNASYTWSHYYGNFDQDNSTTENDDNIFIGSSNIADDIGRQLWDFRSGNLRGDRRHQLKMYGYYDFNWNGRAGAYLVYQSGQPWEAWDVEYYRAQLTAYGSGSTSDTTRYAEPAGSRTTSSHWQLDLNYTHNFRFFSDNNLQLRADLYNVFDNQTGYNIQSKVNSAGFGEPRDFFDPRRLQLAIKFQF
ncbi:MAG TPA: TonB-dependent receptor [Woeseiaceae bacterium]|nr:TonB-dependent receptor [Woeseiaceae bacterium]